VDAATDSSGVELPAKQDAHRRSAFAHVVLHDVVDRNLVKSLDALLSRPGSPCAIS
jgi:hypothetical protein